MRKFIQRALDILPRLNKEQISALIKDISAENDLMATLLDSMIDGTVLLDFQHHIVMMNKAAERFLPLSQHDPLDELIWMVIRDPEISDFIHSSLEKQETVKDRDFTLERGGILQTLAFTITPMVKQGAIQGTIIHIEDVTEKRGEQARLRRAENLASLTTLAAGVAHEIKNPLGSIGIHIQLIQRALNKGGKKIDRTSIEKYLEVVNEEVERLNAIVIDFLFAVRPMDTNLTSSCLNAILTELLDFIQYELEENSIGLNLALSEKLPHLMLDPKYLKPAILNIVKNAIAAMPEGGVLTIRTEEQDGWIVLAIEDDGMGISEENIGKIFEPYFTTKEFGSGLGLTAVYKTLKEHGGEISVKSRENAGTTFFLSFPIPVGNRKLLNAQES